MSPLNVWAGVATDGGAEHGVGSWHLVGLLYSNPIGKR